MPILVYIKGTKRKTNEEEEEAISESRGEKRVKERSTRAANALASGTPHDIPLYRKRRVFSGRISRELPTPIKHDSLTGRPVSNRKGGKEYGSLGSILLVQLLFFQETYARVYGFYICGLTRPLKDFPLFFFFFVFLCSLINVNTRHNLGKLLWTADRKRNLAPSYISLILDKSNVSTLYNFVFFLMAR